MSKILELKEVTLQTKGKTILDNINFEVEKGEQWAIIGLNGSGKTSILNLIAGYQFPTHGEVRILGETVEDTDITEFRKKISYVSNSLERFSEYYRDETVEHIVATGKNAKHGLYDPLTEEDYANVDYWLESFQLDQFKGLPLSDLSEGEKRRVLIARAMMADPKILILDEPCSGLDILAKERFLQSLRSVTASGKCHLIYVTHHIEELMPEITHVLLLEDGNIIGAGPKEKLLTDEYLTKTFHVPVTVRWEDGHPYAKVKRSEL